MGYEDEVEDQELVEDDILDDCLVLSRDWENGSL